MGGKPGGPESWAGRFLVELRRVRAVGVAARLVGRTRFAAWAHRHRDPEFAREWDEILGESLRDEIRATLYQLGVVGWTETEELVTEHDNGKRSVKRRSVTRIYPEVTMRLARVHLPEWRDVAAEDDLAEKLRNALWTARKRTVPTVPLVVGTDASVENQDGSHENGQSNGHTNGHEVAPEAP